MKIKNVRAKDQANEIERGYDEDEGKEEKWSRREFKKYFRRIGCSMNNKVGDEMNIDKINYNKKV